MESARTEDPGLSIAREAAEVLPAESVRSIGNQHSLFVYRFMAVQSYILDLYKKS
ncbi:MAG: hypothetical protein ABWY25_11585 [Paenisporosarcina sp.]